MSAPKLKHCILLYVATFLTGISSRQYAAVSRKRCITDMKLEWSREVGTSAFVGTPIISDMDGDGQPDIVAASFSGEIHVIEGSTGQPISPSQWSHKLAHSSVQSSPLQYDIDQDGSNDLIVMTAEGELLAFTQNGDPITSKSTKIAPLMVRKDWHLQELAAHKDFIHDFILDDNSKAKFKTKEYISVDPHVLANSVICDLNQDNVLEEMVIPISYYFDRNYYSTDEGMENLPNLEFSELKNYLASSLVIMNLTSLTPIKTLHLELTTTTSEYPGYLLFPPTVVDLDSDGGPMEIVVGTSAGQIHAFDVKGEERKSFPIPTDTLHGQVTVADVNGDGRLELVVVDVSSNVACYDVSGGLVWESQVSGSSIAGSRVADVNQDGNPEIIISADDGKLWVLSGEDGKVLPGWPLRLGHKLLAPPLITLLNDQTHPTMVALADDGSLHLIRGNDKCRNAVSLEETSLVPVLSHDLIPSQPGLELLVATHDGTLMCLSQKDEKPETENPALYAWPSELRGTNGFSFGQGMFGVVLHKSKDIGNIDHTSSSVDIRFTIIDNATESTRSSPYRINIYIGSALATWKAYNSPGTHEISIKTPDKPMNGHLNVVCSNRHGQIHTDTMPIRFHMAVLDDVKWLLIGPLVGMSLTLLFVYGFPTSDLLPTSMPVKVL